jgi:hypothetical protein
MPAIHQHPPMQRSARQRFERNSKNPLLHQVHDIPMIPALLSSNPTQVSQFE